jgi:hypothetical protein
MSNAADHRWSSVPLKTPAHQKARFTKSGEAGLSAFVVQDKRA